MENSTKNPSRHSRKVLLISLSTAVLCAVVYFSFFYPPTRNEDTSGTIGAAKKYRSEQITDKDVMLEGQQAQTGSGQAMATDPAVVELQKSAGSLDMAVRDLINAKTASLDQRSVAQLERTTHAVKTVAATYGLKCWGPDATYDVKALQMLQKDISDLEKVVRAGTLEKVAEAGTLSKKAPAAANLEASKSSEALSLKAPQKQFDKVAEAQLSRKDNTMLERKRVAMELFDRAENLERLALKINMEFSRLEQKSSVPE